MFKQRALKVALVLFGLLFCALAYPLVSTVWHREEAGYGDAMMMSLYVTLGVFLLLAARSPTANRSLIAYAGWANLAHAATMSVMVYRTPNDGDLLWGVLGFGVIGIVLLVLVPLKSGSAVTDGGTF